jgi:Fe2+ or Zn2+ uptake regulation protein
MNNNQSVTKSGNKIPTIRFTHGLYDDVTKLSGHPKMNLAAMGVYLHILRWTIGFIDKETGKRRMKAHIKTEKIMKATGMSRRAVFRGLNALKELNIIKIDRGNCWEHKGRLVTLVERKEWKLDVSQGVNNGTMESEEEKTHSEVCVDESVNIGTMDETHISQGVNNGTMEIPKVALSEGVKSGTILYRKKDIERKNRNGSGVCVSNDTPEPKREERVSIPKTTPEQKEILQKVVKLRSHSFSQEELKKEFQQEIERYGKTLIHNNLIQQDRLEELLGSKLSQETLISAWGKIIRKNRQLINMMERGKRIYYADLKLYTQDPNKIAEIGRKPLNRLLTQGA